jgi:ankyrin repeat protein
VGKDQNPSDKLSESCELVLAVTSEENCSQRDIRGTPLMVAAAVGNGEMVRLLVTLMQDVNEVCCGTTALIQAVRNVQPATCRELIRYGARVHIGHHAVPVQALHYAAEVGSYEIAEMILQERAVRVNWVSSRGDTALHVAVALGFLDIVHLLLRFGASPIVVDRGRGRSPTEIAEVMGYTDIVVLLKNSRRSSSNGAGPTERHGGSSCRCGVIGEGYNYFIRASIRSKSLICDGEAVEAQTPLESSERRFVKSFFSDHGWSDAEFHTTMSRAPARGSAR